MFTLAMEGEEFHAGQDETNVNVRERELAIFDQVARSLRETLRNENITSLTWESPELGEVDMLPIVAADPVNGIYAPEYGVVAP